MSARCRRFSIGFVALDHCCQHECLYSYAYRHQHPDRRAYRDPELDAHPFAICHRYFDAHHYPYLHAYHYAYCDFYPFAFAYSISDAARNGNIDAHPLAIRYGQSDAHSNLHFDPHPFTVRNAHRGIHPFGYGQNDAHPDLHVDPYALPFCYSHFAPPPLAARRGHIDAYAYPLVRHSVTLDVLHSFYIWAIPRQ